MYLALRPLILKGSAPEVEHLDVGCTPDIGIYLKISSMVYSIFCGLLFSMLVKIYGDFF